MKSSRPPRAREPWIDALLTIALATGAVAMLAGTFSPWLASGTEHRNLYGAAGVVQRIAELGQPIGYLLDAVPFVGFAVVLGGALWVIGRRGVAGGAVALVALLLGIIAVAALDHRSSQTVRIVALGPMITLTGGGITVLSLVLLLVLGRHADAGHPTRTTGIGSPETAPPARSSRMELT